MKIVAIKDGQVLATFEFDHKQISTKDIWVGRGEDCHLVLRDPKVSRLIGHFQWNQNKFFFLTETNPQTSIQIWPNIPFIWQGIQFLTEGFENIVVDAVKKESENKKISPESLEELNTNQKMDEIGEDQIPLDTPAMLQETLGPTAESNSSLDHSTNAAFNLNIAASDTFNDPNNQFLAQPDESQNPSELQLVDSQFQSEAASLDSPSTKTEFIPQFLQYVLKCHGKGIPYEHFFLEDEKILIGSDSKCQFKVNDVSFPLVAAELKREGGVYSITSMDSSVELIINGKVVNKTMLNDGQHFKLGHLSFDVVVQSEILHQENAALMPVDLVDDETKEYKLSEESKKEREQEQAKDKSKKEKKRNYNFNLKEIWSNPKRRVILYIVVLGLFAVLFDEDKNSGEAPPTDPKVATAGSAGGDASNVEKTDFSAGGKKNSDEKSSGKPVDEKNKNTSKVPNVENAEMDKGKELTPEEKDYVNSHYQLAVSYIEKGEYLPALSEIDLVRSVDEKYRDVQILSNLAKDGLKKIEEEEKRKKELEEKLVREGKVKELVKKAQDALRNDELIAAENLIAMVVEIDPENSEVHNIKLEIEARKEDLRLKEEQLKMKEERRANLVELLLPGKGFFIQKEWFKAIMKINEFLSIKDNDEDLITQASEMMAQSKKEMDLEIAPLLSSARSAKSKEDLKEAYESYIKILKINPSHDEALTESKEMKEVLNERARKIFREAMYKESINLYLKAREKFQEVLLVAPSDSEYYQRAEARLKKLYVD